MLGTVTLGITGGVGALAGGLMADRWGLRAVVIAPRIVLMIVLFPVMKFLIANPSGATLVLAITVLSLLHAASVSVAVMLIPLIFPPAARDRALDRLLGGRRDIRRHGDLCRDLAGWGHRRPIGFHLLRHGGECRDASRGPIDSPR
jgi:hypothetical protein